jgi:hypothetical protein
VQLDFVLGKDGYEMVRGEPVPDITEGPTYFHQDMLDAIIREGNRRYFVAPDRSGRWHEVLELNPGRPKRIYQDTTAGSGTLKNPGNFLEGVVMAALNPDYTIIKRTRLNNFPSSRQPWSERNRQMRTGRTTLGMGTDQDPYRSQDSTKYVAEFLDNNNILPTFIYEDQESHRLGVALRAELGADTIEGTVCNGPDGLYPEPHFTRDDTIADLKSRISRRKIGEGEPGELTPYNLKRLKELSPTIYSGIRNYYHIPPLYNVRFIPDEIALIQDWWGRRKHNDLDNPDDHAVIHDTRAGLRQQNSPITYRFNVEDPEQLEDQIAMCHAFGNLLLNGDPSKEEQPGIPKEEQTSERTIRFVVGIGSRTANADAPVQHVQRTRSVLHNRPDDTNPRRLIAVPGGALTFSQIVSLPAVKAA